MAKKNNLKASLAGPASIAPSQHDVRQLQIIHLSDLHFGTSHNFNPAIGPTGSPLPQAGTKQIAELLLPDLEHGVQNCPTLIAITGDVTTKHEESGFDQASDFIKKLSKTRIMGAVRGMKSIFLIPGNHDVDFTAKATVNKWFRFTNFYNELFSTNYKPGNPLEYVRLVINKSQGYSVLTLNSEIHVAAEGEDQFRGHIDEEQLAKVGSLLKTNEDSLRLTIRIALIHHPVLIPALVEANRGYDAVIRSGQLLNILNKHDFHIILHGHKHWPCTFTVDNANAYDQAYVRPMLVLSGGSLGSRELPPGNSENCYNKINLKWNVDTDEVRIHADTRGLITRDESSQPFPARSSWYWDTLRIHDKIFYRHERMPTGFFGEYTSSPSANSPEEQFRRNEYVRLKGNMPVVEVRPSFHPFQKYEAVSWIVPHPGQHQVTPPASVTWTAGPLFSSIHVKAEQDKRFAGSFAYYGPMLIQATLHFATGPPEHAYVYARILI